MTRVLKSFERFLCVICGLRPDAVDQVPQGRAQAATLGMTMLLVALISSFTSGYALSRAFFGSEWAMHIGVVGGVAWGALVFSIDRLVVVGLDKSRPVDPYQLALRLMLGVVIALVMSKPLVLKFSESALEAELRREQREAISREAAENAEGAGLVERRRTASELSVARGDQLERLRREPDSFEYLRTKQEADRATAAYERLSSINLPIISRLTREIALLVGKNFETPTTTNPGEIELLQEKLTARRRELARTSSLMSGARAANEKATQDWLEAEAANLKQIELQLLQASGKKEAAENKVKAENDMSESEIARLTIPNLNNQYRALRRITGDRSHPDSAAIFTFEIALDLLFLVLELTPMLLKILGRRTPLDDAVAATEFVDTERINLRANSEVSRLQKAYEIACDVEKVALERWRDSAVTQLSGRNVDSSELARLRQELAEVCP